MVSVRRLIITPFDSQRDKFGVIPDQRDQAIGKRFDQGFGLVIVSGDRQNTVQRLMPEGHDLHVNAVADLNLDLSGIVQDVSV